MGLESVYNLSCLFMMNLVDKALLMLLFLLFIGNLIFSTYLQVETTEVWWIVHITEQTMTYIVDQSYLLHFKF